MFNFKGIIYFPLEMRMEPIKQLYMNTMIHLQKVTTEYKNEEINHPQLTNVNEYHVPIL